MLLVTWAFFDCNVDVVNMDNLGASSEACFLVGTVPLACLSVAVGEPFLLVVNG